ncbi:hypothetical protein D3C86_1658860 [compost metagenome]
MILMEYHSTISVRYQFCRMKHFRLQAFQLPKLQVHDRIFSSFQHLRQRLKHPKPHTDLIPSRNLHALHRQCDITHQKFQEYDPTHIQINRQMNYGRTHQLYRFPLNRLSYGHVNPQLVSTSPMLLI